MLMISCQSKDQFSITKQYTKGERFYDPLSNKVSAKDSDDSDGLLGDLYWNKGENTNWNANVFVYYNRLIGAHSVTFFGYECPLYENDHEPPFTTEVSRPESCIHRTMLPKYTINLPRVRTRPVWSVLSEV